MQKEAKDVHLLNCVRIAIKDHTVKPALAIGKKKKQPFRYPKAISFVNETISSGNPVHNLQPRVHH